MVDTTILVYDECWSCGKSLEEGSLVVEVQLLKVSKAVKGIVHLPVYSEDHGNVYSRSCLSCALGPCDETYDGSLVQVDGECILGINGDNLNACYAEWRDHLPEDDPWREYPSED